MRTPIQLFEFDRLYKIEIDFSRGSKDTDNSVEYFYGSEKGAKLRQSAMIGSILTARVSEDIEAAQIVGVITVITTVSIDLREIKTDREERIEAVEWHI